MATINSTIYTIGTALNRAKDAGVSVELLLAGHWLVGMVNAIDGHGIVLLGESGELAIIRVSSIDAVRVRHAAAFDGTPQVEARHEDPMAWPEAQPMPAAAGDGVRDQPASRATAASTRSSVAVNATRTWREPARP